MLNAFMDWLAPRAASGTYVRTVHDVVGDTAPPTSSISCNGTNCSTGWYSAPVSVSLSSTDPGSGVAAIRYTTDGSDPTTSSPLYTGPFSVSTTSTVKFRAWDIAGNAEATQSRQIQIDTTAPTTTALCNGSACGSGWYAAAVSVTLSSSDAGSGIAAVRYTTDGSDPTTASALYNGAFPVSQTTTLKYRAWDNAGNAETTNTRLVQVDTTAPAVAITSPAGGSTVTGNTKIVAAPGDAQSGVASVRFYVDGVLVGTVTGSPWQVAWNTKKTTKGQHSLTAVATNRAGTATTSAAVTVTVR